MPPIDDFFSSYATLFVIMDPIGTLPIYLGLVGGLALKDQRIVMIWAMIYVTILLFATVFFGEYLLSLLNVSKEAFAIAGGLFLFWTAFEMIFEKRQKRRQKATSDAKISSTELRAMAASPLTIPLLAGPGTLTATIILSSNFEPISQKFYLLGIITLVILTTALTFFAGGLLSRYLDDAIRIFISRIMGLILGALAVQTIVNAVMAISANG